MKPKPFVYNIEKILKYVDGDTIDVRLDLGFNTFVEKRVRLYGINTPEVRTRDKKIKERGLKAKARLQELCEEESGPLILVSHGLGKYGRVIGELITQHNLIINRVLVIEGHAEEYIKK